MNGRLIILYFALKYEGNWEKIYNALFVKEKAEDEEIIKKVENFKHNFITIIDEAYPDYLKHICRAPFILFYYGDISLISDKYTRISVVGSRKVSNYGAEATISLVKDLCKELVVVSGMAWGVDELAHTSAIKNGGKTIAVLGSGIDVCYPECNRKLYEEIKKNHLLISELPPDAKPCKTNFPNRNRIVAGLSRCLLIPEGKRQSGTSITSLLMIGNGGEVCCVPARIGEDSLCNHLIKSGATLVENAEEIFFAMGYTPKQPLFDEVKIS